MAHPSPPSSTASSDFDADTPNLAEGPGSAAPEWATGLVTAEAEDGGCGVGAGEEDGMGDAHVESVIKKFNAVKGWVDQLRTDVDLAVNALTAAAKQQQQQTETEEVVAAAGGESEMAISRGEEAGALKDMEVRHLQTEISDKDNALDAEKREVERLKDEISKMDVERGMFERQLERPRMLVQT